jgi:dipeptidyl aminopeptidase/acylaminoacyl peptidase
LPDGADSGPRALAWRSDQSATLTWAQARAKDGPAHDQLYAWQAPFAREAEVFAEVEGRVVRALWGRPDLAVLEVRPPDGGLTRSIVFDPGRVGQTIVTGRALPQHRDQRLLTTEGPEGSERLALSIAGFPLVLEDPGSSANGRILEWHSHGGASKVIHEFATGGQIQRIAAVLDSGAGTALAWRESSAQPPNLFLLDAARRTAKRLTDFGDPAPAYAGMRMVPLAYRRNDGIPLAAKLYLPAAVDKTAPRPLATVLWAYPVTRAAEPDTGARRDDEARFVRPGGVDPLLLTASGYAVLIADMPLVPAKGGEVENYTDQLVANSAAAIEASVASGWVDRNRVAVAGHSFGAGMAVSLLGSADLFATGIALSGAYNRTLTPFGFQTERRSLWEAPDLYHQASPFLRADAIDEPLLLIHGMQDTNSGASPMQSERLFAALRGLGKQARLVLLPGEGHAYTARESVFHTMYEIERWLARHLGPPAGRAPS